MTYLICQAKVPIFQITFQILIIAISVEVEFNELEIPIVELVCYTSSFLPFLLDRAENQSKGVFIRAIKPLD